MLPPGELIDRLYQGQCLLLGGGSCARNKNCALGLYSVMFTVAGNDRLECHTRGFRVTDTRGTVLFSADKNEVVVGAEVLRVTGELILMFVDYLAPYTFTLKILLLSLALSVSDSYWMLQNNFGRN